MILLIIVASIFFRSAKKRALNGFLWAILAVLTWFAAQIIAGVIIAFTNERLLDNDFLVMMWGVVASVLGSIGLFVLLQLAAKRKSEKKIFQNDEIMDDPSIDDL